MSLTVVEVCPKHANKISNLNDVQFDGWSNYFKNLCQSRDKYLDGLKISTQHSDSFSAPWAIEDMIRCVQRYPEVKDDIINMMVDYHTKCSDPKIHSGRQMGFAKAYACYKQNNFEDYNKYSIQTRQVIDVAERLVAQDMRKYRMHQLSQTEEKGIMDPIMKGQVNKGNGDILLAIEKQYAQQTQHQEILSLGIQISFLQKGTKIDFLQPTSQETGVPSELLQTSKMFCKIDEKNPDIVVMEGLSKENKSTFKMKYNRKKKQYVYKGGTPEKVYSNDPALGKEEFSPVMNSFMKRNFRHVFDEVKVKEELAKGIVFQDKDKKVRVSVEDDKIVHVQVKDKEGKPFLDFEIDRETKQYVAKNMQSGNIYSNEALFKKHPCYKGELPDYIGKSCHDFYQKAKNIARTNRGISLDNQRQ